MIELERPWASSSNSAGRRRCARGGARAPRRPAARDGRRRDRPRRGPRRDSASCSTRLGYQAPPYAPRDRRGGAGARRPRSAIRCWCAPATCSAGARWRSSTGTTTSSGTWSARSRPPTGATILLDRFLEHAIEVDVDALCDGSDVWIGGSWSTSRKPDPLRRLGVRAAAALARPEMLADQRADARHRARLGVVGLLNVQFAAPGRRRALRDRGQPARVAHGAVRLQGDRLPLAKLACRIMLGESIAELGLPATPSSGTTSPSRRRCCRSIASSAPTRFSGPRCARPAR